jgi:hypothetical protein
VAAREQQRDWNAYAWAEVGMKPKGRADQWEESNSRPVPLPCFQRRAGYGNGPAAVRHGSFREPTEDSRRFQSTVVR